ncbi:MAG: YdcF family protein [Salinisphaera sp.]|jgi:SanA protein|nr:YdcF family protein [Salinisphaera sp.]
MSCMRWSLTGIGLLLTAALLANAWIITSTRGAIYDDASQVTVHDVGLVLGTSPYTHTGNPNELFANRIKAAAQLYHDGKVRHLLVSGANPDRFYNEPRKMYQALRRKGVPGSAITLDYAGFRTLDSIVRARRIFELPSFVIISQRYHDYRALFLARHKGIDAVAYIWPGEDRRQPLRTELREYLARVKAVLDLYVLHTRPRFLGPRRPIDLEPSESNDYLIGDDGSADGSSIAAGAFLPWDAALPAAGSRSNRP